MTDAVRLLDLELAVVLVGLAAALVAGLPLRLSWLPTLAGLAPALGLAWCGLAAALGAMVGFGVGLLSTALVALCGLGVLRLALRGRSASVSPVPPRTGLAAAGSWPELVVLAGLAALSIWIVRLYAVTGLDAWDGWAIWAPKAHALFVEGDAWSPVFTEPAYLMQHQEYPILFPALEALSAHGVGRFDPTLIDIPAAAVLVSFGWGVWAVLRLVVAPLIAACAALALMGSAPLIDNGAANYADAVLASFLALGLLCLLTWLARGDRVLLVSAAILLAAAASTKAEGLVFAAAAVVAAILTAGAFGRSRRAVLALGAAVFAVPVVWAVVDRLNGPGARNIDRDALFMPGTMVDRAGRVPTAAWTLLDAAVTGWPVLAGAILAALIAACAVRMWSEVAFVVLWGALSFVALVGVYYANTAPLDWLLGTSADRVVMTLVLGLGVTAPVLAYAAWQRVAVQLGDRLGRARSRLGRRADRADRAEVRSAP